MESLDEIYAALERPLALAAQDDHRYLSRIKNLDRTIPLLASRAAAAVSSPKARRAFKELATAFADYPALGTDAKRAAVRKGLDLIARARNTQAEGEPSPEGGRVGKSGEGTKTYRVPIVRFKGVGEKTAARLGKLGIADSWQALWSIPREYQIQLPPRPVSELSPGMIGTVDVRVTSVRRPFRIRSGVRIYEVLFEDDSGTVPAV